jgi:hypothetical protein
VTPTHYVSAARVRDLKRILSERDLAIVQTVAELRFVSGSQLRRIHVTSGTALGNERVARKVLARLVELGVLDRLERRIGGPGPAGSEGYVYVLALGGQSLTYPRKASGRTRRRRRVVTPGQMFVGHTLAVSEVHTRLIEAERDGCFVIAERLAEPACWRRFTSEGEQATLKPDLAATVVGGLRARGFLIDVDRGTEGTRTLERRLGIYGRYRVHQRASGESFPQVLWLARTDKRVRVITAALGCLAQPDYHFHVARFERMIDAITDML